MNADAKWFIAFTSSSGRRNNPFVVLSLFLAAGRRGLYLHVFTESVAAHGVPSR
jgi:hypothetical protein